MANQMQLYMMFWCQLRESWKYSVFISYMHSFPLLSPSPSLHLVQGIDSLYVSLLHNTAPFLLPSASIKLTIPS